MIVFIIDSVERFKFYSRMFPALKKQYQVVIVTHDPAIYFLCKIRKYTSYLITKIKRTSLLCDKSIEDDVKLSIEFLNNDFNFEQSLSNYLSSLHILESIFSTNKIEKCIIWNGETLIAKAATRACDKYNIDKVYLEISNLPNKMFSDPLGVNAKSSLYSEPSILDSLPAVDNSFHTEWVLHYENSKKGVLPQSRICIKNKIISGFGFILKNIYPSTYKKQLSKIKFSHKINFDKLIYDNKFDIKNNEYLFLPLQVSTDTQIKLNSNIDNQGAIDFGMKKSKELGIPLVIKIHPAEKQQSAIDEIAYRQRADKFILVKHNTVALIKNAKELIVINSTVGLEALIYEKKVTVLGRAVYKDFDQERLRKYIHGYLIDEIDYFSNESISSKSVLKFLCL